MKVPHDLQQLCQRGQELLSRTDYLAAERLLVEAEKMAWEARNWETLARLYMPLQEARRQRRQLCGEGTIRLDLFGENLKVEDDPSIAGGAGASSPRNGPGTPQPFMEKIVSLIPQGQLLVAGNGSITPGIELRRLAAERNLYLETFLGAAYTIGQGRMIVIVGLEESPLPAADGIKSIDQLLHQAPVHSLVLSENELIGADKQTYAHMMSLWERLHLPYLAAANAEVNPIRRMEAYRTCIRVDYACELAHQRLAGVAAGLGRTRS